jgi:hypothetical protein
MMTPGDAAAADAAGAGHLPEMVVAPARPDVREAHEGDVIFEVRRAADGGLILPVFTTVNGLVAALGPAQPWVVLPLRNIREIMGATGIDRVVLDPDAEPDAWRWQPGDIAALRESVR